MNAKYAIIYNSKTGNTQQVAKAIGSALPEEDCFYFGGPEGMKVPGDASLIFVGFWTDKGTCDEGCSSILRTLAGKTVALFGTAGFGGSPEYYHRIMGAVKSNAPEDCDVSSSFMCQGRMPSSVRQRYEKMKLDQPEEAARFDQMIANFDGAQCHPNEADLEAAAAWARSSWIAFSEK